MTPSVCSLKGGLGKRPRRLERSRLARDRRRSTRRDRSGAELEHTPVSKDRALASARLSLPTNVFAVCRGGHSTLRSSSRGVARGLPDLPLSSVPPRRLRSGPLRTSSKDFRYLR